MAAGNYSPVDGASQVYEIHEIPMDRLRSPSYRKPVVSASIDTLNDTKSQTHLRNLSGSTATSVGKDEDASLRRLLASPTKITVDGSWFREIACLLVGGASVISIIVVLAVFSDSPLPDWPLSITLNTLIALLVALANAALAVPLSSGFSQLKWVWFKQRPAPLGDMELFDEASRGSWGAARLLGNARGGAIGSFGAVITIVALILGPFSQQVATYPTRSAISSRQATIPAAVNYTGVLPGDTSTGFVPILPMKSAVYSGLFAEAGQSFPSFTCESGNCTYEQYSTLAVCSNCVNLTPFLTRYCNETTDQSQCGWQVPQGALLRDDKDVFSMTSYFPSLAGDMPYTNIIKLIFMGTEAQDGQPLNYNPWATQCTLDYCAQTIDSAIVNGKISENVTAEIHNNSVVDITNSQGTIPVSIISSENKTLFISEPAMLGIQSWFSTIFTNGSASRNSSFESLNQAALVVVNLTVGISSGTTYFDTDVVQTFYWDYYEYADGLPKAMSDLASAMTVAFRSFNGAIPVSGIATTLETYVKVRWGWISLPLFVVLATAVFLVLAMTSSSRSGTELWKGSALALLFYGLDHATKVQFGTSGGFEEKKKIMKDVRVRLDDDRNFGSVLRS
ncbi:hypothetical protein BP5796_11878 [Coleophoma crateriformis]|uniref:Uncharacterized protein n=1 Tax=Coleophoma crateriformis TaxID=565419 RepID=A0A3D8QEK1_9HELO|nr:hypothetical protein BP5796_11878 [Coleophoma crateriformis]